MKGKVRDVLEGIFHVRCHVKPFWIKHVVTSSTMSNHTGEAVFMRMRNPHSIISTTTDSPRNNSPTINPILRMYPIKHTTPQTIGSLGIIGISRTVARSRDLDTDGREPVGDVVGAGASVFGSVPVQSVDGHHDGEFLAGFSAER